MKSNFSIQWLPRRLGALFILTLFLTGMASAGQKNKKPLSPPPAPPPTPTTGSLFTDQGRLVNVYSEFRAQQIGDIVFVDIVETSAASVSSNAKNAREGSNLGAAVIAAAPIPGQIAGAAAGVAGALGSRTFNGKGSTERNSQLRARIAAKVVEVLPNGDLRIEAQKQLKINRESEKLKLSGIVRLRDITPENSVLSTSIASLQVELNGKGVASSANGPGWLARFLEKIAPF